MELNVEGLEMQKRRENGKFSVFFADDGKTLATVYAKHFFEFFQKMVWFIGFGVTVCELSWVEIFENC